METVTIVDIGQARASDRPTNRDLGHLRRLISYLRPHGWIIAGALVALTIASATVLSVGVGLRWLIDNGFGGGDPGALDTALLILIAVIAVLALATYARFYLVSWLGERVVADIRRDVYDHVIGLSPTFFESTPTGEILSRLTTDTTLLQVVVGSSASIALRNALLFIGATVMLAVTSPKLTGLVFLLVPAVVFPIVFFGRRVRRLSRDSQDKVADAASHVEETVNAVNTVQAFNHEDIDRARFRDRVETAFVVAIRRVRARGAMTAFVMLTVFGAIALVLWVGGRDVMAGAISAGELSQFIFFAIVVAGAVGAISEVLGDLQRAAGATERLMALLSVAPEIVTAPTAVPLHGPVAGAVAFDNVTFHYPTRHDAPALEGLTFSIAPGESIALVGPSGAGKTTIFQLLQRFYDPQAGRVTLDGTDLRNLDPRDVRRCMAIVPQEPAIFGNDAWENIGYGRPEAGRDAIRDAARAAAAEGFLDELPDGFGTHLGPRGVRLSGGQRQRIAIARAVLRDPAVLLLDEATSALDAESERVVQQALSELMAGRTTLIIAHRLATVRNADRIIVIDKGRVVATGDHDTLVAEGGLYARLVALEFRDGGRIASTVAAQ